ncbi:hypothetical protein FKM82_023605 [Ascaphus truei]
MLIDIFHLVHESHGVIRQRLDVRFPDLVVRGVVETRRRHVRAPDRLDLLQLPELVLADNLQERFHRKSNLAVDSTCCAWRYRASTNTVMMIGVAIFRATRGTLSALHRHEKRPCHIILRSSYKATLICDIVCTHCRLPSTQGVNVGHTSIKTLCPG